MAEWQGKTRGGLLGYQIFVWLLKRFGLNAAYLLLYFVAFYFIPFAPKATKALFQFYRTRLGYGLFATCISIYRNYYAFGQSLIDRVAIKSGISKKFSYYHDGDENLSALVKEGKGGFLISAHIGNWDIAGFFMKRLNGKINIVMYDEEHNQIKEYLKSVGETSSVNIIPIKDDFSHIIAIKNALSEGELITMHGDRFREGNRTIKLKFLGEDAFFPQGPFLLATKFKVPVSFVFCVKESKYHYHLFATPGKVFSSVEELSSVYSLGLEEKIRKYPMHWNNYYDFWKNPNES
ncbi:MAG: lipid A biosynthesis acyltransferase [Bacteroidia bacterium]|nr:lipid A biosynthesis acyltransferase [Bacteroidia bacterium]